MMNRNYKKAAVTFVTVMTAVVCVMAPAKVILYRDAIEFGSPFLCGLLWGSVAAAAEILLPKKHRA